MAVNPEGEKPDKEWALRESPLLQAFLSPISSLWEKEFLRCSKNTQEKIVGTFGISCERLVLPPILFSAVYFEVSEGDPEITRLLGTTLLLIGYEIGNQDAIP